MRHVVSLVISIVVWKLVVGPAVYEAVKALETAPPMCWVANLNPPERGGLAPPLNPQDFLRQSGLW